MSKKSRNLYSAWIFILAGYISLNILPDKIINHLFGTIFLISGIYGLVAFFKSKKFIF